jgi:hypothetical protein
MDQTELSNDLLRGAAAIAMEIFGRDDLSAQRKVHHLRARLPVFQIDDKKGGALFAFRSRLRAHLENMSAEKESRLAAAVMVKPAVVRPSRRRRHADRQAAKAAAARTAVE